MLHNHPSENTSPDRPASSFLVTCVGAYDDSGIGTGGFVCVHEGKATIIDRIDSTGLCAADGVYYRFARGLRSIVGYAADGLRYQLKIPEARDIHDIALHHGQFVCVSTGTNEIFWLDPLGRVVRRWKGEGERDAWHLNCLCESEGRLYFSAFGRFTEHRGWVGKCGGTGLIVDLESGQEVVTGLNGPHNPRFIGGEWWVCDSHANALVVQRPGEAPRIVALDGFTRGLDCDDGFLYVGESANRKAEIPAEHSAIAIVRRGSHKVVSRIEIPFPEIYEVMIVPAEFAASMTGNVAGFQVDQSAERYAQLEHQVQIGWKEIDALKRRIEPLRGIEYFRGKLVELKRRMVG